MKAASRTAGMTRIKTCRGRRAEGLVQLSRGGAHPDRTLGPNLRVPEESTLGMARSDVFVPQGLGMATDKGQSPLRNFITSGTTQGQEGLAGPILKAHCGCHISFYIQSLTAPVLLLLRFGKDLNPLNKEQFQTG